MKTNHPSIEVLHHQDVPKTNIDFGPGDTITVATIIVDDEKKRTQSFTGVVIKRQNTGISETVTVRKTQYGINTERTFPLKSPIIASITVVKKGAVRRARIYYFRKLRGKAAKIKSPKTISKC